MKYWILNPINCFGTSESIGKNETRPVAKRNLKLASKGIAIILIIVIAFYIVSVIYKIVLLNYLEERFKEYDNWDNYYVEIRSFDEARLTEERKIWYRDNKYKIVTKTYWNNNIQISEKKWIDCNNSLVIYFENGELIKDHIDDNRIKSKYQNGIYIYSFFDWKKQINDERDNILNIWNRISMIDENEEIKLIFNKNTIYFKKDSIIPKLYVENNQKRMLHKYYEVKLNETKDEVFYYFL